MTSFFVSYNSADRAWAEWIAWILEEAGHMSVIQAWDFRPGGNFVLDMQRAAAETDKTIVVLSEDYLKAEFTQPEWASAFADDPTSLERKIIPIRVRECKPRGLLRPIVYVDLVKLEEKVARQAILDALPERLKPTTAPSFPKLHDVSTGQTPPEFPNLPASALWNVPYERNAFFTGREDVLEALYQRLSKDGKAALSQAQVISGLGGIGKTQTAVEYAYRRRHDYQAVFWVRSETDQELRTSFVEIARLLNLSQKNDQDPNDTIQAVKHWLETHSGWLLIFDNADYPEQLASFRPRQVQGHILLTSRAQTFDSLGIARPISLQKMPAEDAVAFLFKRAGREADDPSEQEAAAALAEELGYLPLALEQAGAFILRRQLRFRTYLSQYRQQRLALLERQQPKVGNEQQPSRSVRTTWQLNFQAVEEINPASAQLLQFSAFVAPDTIPYELLILGGASLGSLLANALAAEDKDEGRFVISEVLEPLSQYSLIRVEPDIDSYTIHRLVQEVVKAEMDEKSRHLWAERTIEAVAQVFPDAEYGNWPLCDRLLPHAMVAMCWSHLYSIESESAGRLLNQIVTYLGRRIRYSEAEPLFQKALAMRKRLLGDEHPAVAESLHNLAWLYKCQWRYSEAEPLYQEALEMRKRLLGNEHPAVAENLHNLADLYSDQGRYSEVEPLYQEALEMRKRLLGEAHPAVAKSLNNLALLFYNEGRYSEAELLYQQALEMRKRLLGEAHPAVAESLDNLAGLYDNQGRYSEAEPLYKDALALYKCLLGNEHPSVATSINNLAWFYDNQGRYSEAEPLYKEALGMRKRLLGDEHPSVAISLNNLAALYDKQGCYSEAEPLFQEALALLEKKLGLEHPSTKTVQDNLEGLRNQQDGEERKG